MSMNAGPFYLIAPSGNPNFGDEFIAASWLRYLASTQPGVEVYLDCPQPGLAQVLFSDLHPHLRVTNTLWRAVADAASSPSADMGARVADLVTNLGSPQYDLGLLKLREATSLHLLGGGYINGMWPHHYGLIAGMTAVRELSGARLFATGLGLMPFVDDGSINPHALFDGFEYASARDTVSAQTFALTQGIDDAFLGIAGEIGRNSLASDSLCICIQSDTVDVGYLDWAIEIAREHIAKAKSGGKATYYFEAIPGEDRTAFERLSDLIPADNFIPFAEIWRNGLPLSSNQQWLTTRFHFHLLAATAGARGTVISAKTGYYDVKHNSVLDLGSGWDYIAFHESFAAGKSNTLTSDFRSLTKRKLIEADKLYPESSPAQASSSVGRALLRTVKRRIKA